MHKAFRKIEHLMRDKRIQVISVMKNKVWISHDNQKYKEININMDDEELNHLIKAISKGKGKKVNHKNPIWQGRSPKGFRTDIVLPPLSMDGIVLTMYKRNY